MFKGLGRPKRSTARVGRGACHAQLGGEDVAENVTEPLEGEYAVTPNHMAAGWYQWCSRSAKRSLLGAAVGIARRAGASG